MRKLLRKKLRPKLKALKAKPKAKIKARLKAGLRPKGKGNSMRDDLLEKMTAAELKDLAGRVEKAIAARIATDRSELRNKLKALAEDAGFSLDELVGGGRGRKGRAAGAKFANPSNPSETWSGRGRQPKWLSSKLKAGAKLDEFRA